MKKVVFIEDKFKSKVSKITDITHLICTVHVCYTVNRTEVLSAFLWDVKFCRNVKKGWWNVAFNDKNNCNENTIKIVRLKTFYTHTFVFKQ